MVDYEKIGKRILEQRKFMRKISQERMAEDLGMYQADISNLEKAKKGSGITDLSKLDMIAEYFDLPLETLLFGRRQDQMEKYYGSKMKLKQSTKRKSRKHESMLCNLMGIVDSDNCDKILERVSAYECGPYTIYVSNEYQIEYNGEVPNNQELDNFLVKAHIYVVYLDEVIGCMTAAVTSIMQHIYRPAMEKLKTFIQPDIFDVQDTIETLNPFCLLYRYADTDDTRKEYEQKLYHRMDMLRGTGENGTIFYVESTYVREDSRRIGILRMMIDVLKKLDETCLIWISLEPSSGSELTSEYSYHPSYEVSELGQINTNASIAERLGFTIDPKTVDRLAEQIEEDGSIVLETVPVRRAAYYLTRSIRDIIKKDGNLLSYARALEKAVGGDLEKPQVVDIFQSAWKKKGFVVSIKLDYSNETVYTFARGMDWKSRWIGVSKYNPSLTGEFVDTLERYDCLENAVNSPYYLGMMVAEQLLGAVYFGKVDPKDIQLDALQ